MDNEILVLEVNQPKITRDRLEKIVLHVLNDPDIIWGYHYGVRVIE